MDVCAGIVPEEVICEKTAKTSSVEKIGRKEVTTLTNQVKGERGDFVADLGGQFSHGNFLRL
jgi:hypothetical protein